MVAQRPKRGSAPVRPTIARSTNELAARRASHSGRGRLAPAKPNTAEVWKFFATEETTPSEAGAAATAKGLILSSWFKFIDLAHSGSFESVSLEERRRPQDPRNPRNPRRRPPTNNSQSAAERYRSGAENGQARANNREWTRMDANSNPGIPPAIADKLSTFLRYRMPSLPSLTDCRHLTA